MNLASSRTQSTLISSSSHGPASDATENSISLTVTATNARFFLPRLSFLGRPLPLPTGKHIFLITTPLQFLKAPGQQNERKNIHWNLKHTRKTNLFHRGTITRINKGHDSTRANMCDFSNGSTYYRLSNKC